MLPKFVKLKTLLTLLMILTSGSLYAVGARSPQVVRSVDMNAAVSLRIAVTEDGSIDGTMVNNTQRKVGDVELLVEYTWVWANDFNHGEDNPAGRRLTIYPWN